MSSNLKVLGTMERFRVAQNTVPRFRIEVGFEKVDQALNMMAS